MANWYGTARSNYFKVKDLDEFKEWVGEQDLGYWEKNGRIAVYSTECDTGAWPTVWELGDEDHDEDGVELCDALAKFLADGEICVLMEAGTEKMRYITGWAQAFDNSGKVVQVSLDDIYNTAIAEFGYEPTLATY